MKLVITRYFLFVGQTSVIFTILTWCWPRTHDILRAPDRWEATCLQVEGNRQVPSVHAITWELSGFSTMKYRSVFVFLSAKFSFISSSLLGVITKNYEQHCGNTWYEVTQLVRTLHYNLGGPGFNSRWSLLDYFQWCIRPHYGPKVNTVKVSVSQG